MNSLKCLWILCMFFDIAELGKPFSCFHCHQTSKQCNYGDKMILKITNCPTNTCFVLKYETEMPGVNVKATFRGCYLQPEQEMMKNLVTYKHFVSKKHFQLCNSSLCNDASSTKVPPKIMHNHILLLILLSFIFGKL
ncbi:unnamed protein product [Phaedon cochleariae]|uniref:Uncharacterized protein n=1 Tax=Phaedon cochleariae TaxID=80249 RepID=A0A9N9X1J6_PHACE|nr:unnamed protein product [Phaedon cochleariae]